jgi:hypothetical protein
MNAEKSKYVLLPCRRNAGGNRYKKTECGTLQIFWIDCNKLKFDTGIHQEEIEFL